MCLVAVVVVLVVVCLAPSSFSSSGLRDDLSRFTGIDNFPESSSYSFLSLGR
jgi:hypothetical protein